MHCILYTAIIAAFCVSVNGHGGGAIRHVYQVKKDKTTQMPTPSPSPSVAALDTTVAVMPNLTTEAKLPTTTAREAESTSSSKMPEISEAPGSPSTEAPMVETSTPNTAAPHVETTVEEAQPTTTMEPNVETPIAPVTAGRPEITKSPKPIPTLPPVDFDCRRKDDGYYANPKDKCSSHFYACIGGLARRLDCGAGDLVYEPESGACERRHESYRCTGNRKTTVPTTPRRPPPPPPKLIIDCSKLDDGWYSDPHKKCSHTFYSCSNGIGSRFDCPGHMYFDIETKSCQAFQDVVACAGKKRVTTTKKVKPTTPTVTEKLPIDCSDKASGQYADPLKKCSQIYYVCSNGDGIKRMCPDGLFYDKKKQMCDYYSEIYACVGRTKPATKVTMAPKPSEASLLSNEYNCKTKPDGSYTPDDKKCSDIYFRCVGGATYKLKCPEGLYFDMANDLCDRWYNLFVCSGKMPTSPLPTTPTTPPKPTEKLPIDCSANPDGDFPDPEKKCSSTYYSCSNFGGLRRLCPDKTYFDKNTGICDVRENVPDCSGKPRPTTARPIKPSRLPNLPYNCEKRTDGNYPAGKCIGYYWSCVGGSTVRASCPHGTYFDSELDECGYKEEMPSCGGVRPTTKKP